jgi:predicted alpha-1,2-mannosidase
MYLEIKYHIRVVFVAILLTIVSSVYASSNSNLTQYVNPLLGTATLWTKQDLQYERHRKARTWGAEVFPGTSLPCAMVQLSPITMYHSGAGYQYEDSLIYGFAHTNKGHWNLLHIPLMPVIGNNINPDNFASTFSHRHEEAHPGFYEVYLERYGIDVKLTSTLRCGYHQYTFRPGDRKRLIADMTRSNNRVTSWDIEKAAPNAFCGFQEGEGKMYFYAVANYDIESISNICGKVHTVSLVDFKNSINDDKPLELKIGFSFVSIENAKMNLQHEILGKNFVQVRNEADRIWNDLLSKIEVKGSTERMKRIFYSCLYRSMLWPALRSDVNNDYTDVNGKVCNYGSSYYTIPSFWDDHRNKLILLGLLLPNVTTDVIKTCIDCGEKQGGYMPTFFHGDHASTFIAGSYLRGLRDFSLRRAYKLLLKNATIPGEGGRPYLDEYLKRGWIAEKDTTDVPYYDEYKAAVTKTLEYAYDDYATAQIARIIGDRKNYKLLMKHSGNYKNVFDASTGFYRGRISNGSFIRQFDPYYPYFAYQYREANAWQLLFYAPHDPYGVLRLYPSKRAVELKLDSLFNEPWRGYEVENLTGFIGNYCHGNQPGHSQPYMYYFVGRQDKAQAILDSIMYHYYDMGVEHLALAGMDDAGELSSWFVFNAIGLYTYSPADPQYIVTVPLFDEVNLKFTGRCAFTIIHRGKGRKITNISVHGKLIKGYFLPDSLLRRGGSMVIVTTENR